MKYKAVVTRIGCGKAVIEVEAANASEAYEAILDVSGDYEYSEYTADYEIENLTEITSQNSPQTFRRKGLEV